MKAKKIIIPLIILTSNINNKKIDINSYKILNNNKQIEKTIQNNDFNIWYKFIIKVEGEWSKTDKKPTLKGIQYNTFKQIAKKLNMDNSFNKFKNMTKKEHKIITKQFFLKFINIKDRKKRIMLADILFNHGTIAYKLTKLNYKKILIWRINRIKKNKYRKGLYRRIIKLDKLIRKKIKPSTTGEIFFHKKKVTQNKAL